MELLCAILTAVLLWLFIYYCVYGYQIRARRKAGRLLLRFEKPRSKMYWLGEVANLVGIGAVATVLLVYAPKPAFQAISPVYAFLCVCAAMRWGFDLWLLSRSLELREHGLVASYGTIVFAPWHYVTYCRWKPDLRELFVQYEQKHMEYPIQPEQVDAVNEILVQHVEVRNADGTIIGDSDRCRNRCSSEAADELPEPEVRRWQFNLRTLLLFMVVCSSAFGWWRIRTRDWEQQRQVIAQFERMQPRVTYSFKNVSTMDFSACKIKPTDDDLVHLSKLPSLKRLNLTGAPITDAGLKHLEGLTSLQSVQLYNTQVTAAGIKALERALPDTTIWHQLNRPSRRNAARGTDQK